MALSGTRIYVAVVGLYGAIIFAIGLLPSLGLYFPKFPYEDVYIPYLFVAGPVVFAAGYWAEAHCWAAAGTLLTPWAAGWVCIVVVPGVVDFVLGSLQWIAVAMLARVAFGLARRLQTYGRAKKVDQGKTGLSRRHPGEANERE